MWRTLTRRPLGLVLASLLAFALPAEAKRMAPGTAPSADPKIDFEKYTLPNGLEVILMRDVKTPIVFVNLWYHVGAADEVPGRSGFAHLFEHMMFQGTKNTGEDQHFKVLSQIGASGVNGTTSFDRTNYFEQVPSNQLETALWLESERMGYLLGAVTDKSLANQIDVVKNERRQRYENVPYGSALFKLFENLFPEGHPQRYLGIGRQEDLTAASLDDVKNFFKKWYVPSNATLVIAGDFEPEAAKKAVEKWFGNFPASTRPKQRVVGPAKLAATKRVVVEDGFAKLRRIGYTWHSPMTLQPGDAELDILGSALGREGTGRLYKKLVLDKPLARSVSVGQSSFQRGSIFSVTVELNPDADLAEVEKIINAEIATVQKEPISDREFRRAVVGYEAQFVWGLESVSAKAEQLQWCNHFTGNPDCITFVLDLVRNSSPDKVLAVAKQVLAQPRVEVLVVPAGGK
jgi:zinc protease